MRRVVASGQPVDEVMVDGHAVRFTSGDRVVFPALGASGGTKRHLLDYHLAVGEPLLAGVRGRAVYLQRFPTGLDGQEVYTKRLPASPPEYVRGCRVEFPSGRSAVALCPQNIAALAWAVQMSTVTLHSWPALGADLRHPDELRIDLDPQPGTGFADARDVAVEVLAPLLDELGYRGFVKTSGGRGLHVAVRIQRRWDAPTVRRAAIALARELERRADGRVTTAWWKEQRGQAVFVDYNQNASDHTLAAAYAVRATATATVSTPLTWDELVDAEPGDLTIATVPDLLARRGDPWAELDDVAHDLSPLLENAERDASTGLGDLPYPPNHPKVAGEPKRVQPSRDRDRPR